MKRKLVDIQTLREMEERGYVEVYYPGSLEEINDTIGDLLRWSKNYQDLTFKYRKISVDKILDFIDCEYVCDVLISKDEETNSITWIYLYAKDLVKLDLHELSLTKDKYVYVLTNSGYPGICKIGKAVNPLTRVTQINNAGTVSEWDLRYAYPVTDDYKVENYIHRHLASVRQDSDQGSSREFFKISLDMAIDAVNYYAQDFKAGEPIIY